MASLLQVTKDLQEGQRVAQALRQAGLPCSLQEELPEPSQLEEKPLDLLLVDLTCGPPHEVQEFLSHCRKLSLPVVLLLPGEALPDYPFTWGAEDFVVKPVQEVELVARVRQVLWRTRGLDSRKVIRRGDLIIDVERYEVSVAGRRVLLTFKEYQLLKLLASSPGRVYTREALLNRIWGHDYFGDTRTVDVHIRRLRSKIEDAHHAFIETVWNVGYRFRAPA